MSITIDAYFPSDSLGLPTDDFSTANGFIHFFINKTVNIRGQRGM